MFFRGFPSLLCVILAASPMVMAQEPEKAKADSGMDEKQKTSYAVGVQFGKAVADGAEFIDLEAMTAGLKDSLAEVDLKLTEEEMGKLLQALQKQMQDLQKQKLASQYSANKKEGEDYLAANTTKEGVKTLPSGLQYKVITEGTGRVPKSTDMVSTHYRGTLIDGTEFDSSYKRNQPAEFPVTRVIAGWTEALQLMKEGSKWELYVPYALAYGEEGRLPQIPPYSLLIFQVELLKVVDAAQPGQSVTIKPPQAPKPAAPK